MVLTKGILPTIQTQVFVEKMFDLGFQTNLDMNDNV